MLEIKGISVGYPLHNKMEIIMKDFSLSIAKGEVVVILGPSGCGKSTLLNVVAGNKKVERGEIVFDIDNAQKVAIIPQDCGLLPWKTVRNNCLLPLKIRKEKMDEKKKCVFDRIIKDLGIEEILQKYPKQLSGGQAQRVAIARAFIDNPDILLMDEPFSALDAITREEAEELFLRIWNKNKVTTIFVTHNMEEALYLGSRILVLGEKGGDIRYEMKNSFFGQLFPEEAEYLQMRAKLRSMLRTKEEGALKRTEGSMA